MREDIDEIHEDEAEYKGDTDIGMWVAFFMGLLGGSGWGMNARVSWDLAFGRVVVAFQLLG